MIVCSCQAVSDREIRAAVRRGARSAADAQTLTGAGTGCGGCRMAVNAVVAEALEVEPQIQTLPIFQDAFRSPALRGLISPRTRGPSSGAPLWLCCSPTGRCTVAKRIDWYYHRNG